MPYASNEDLPPRVKNNIPSDGGKTLFRTVFNSQVDRGRTETVAFASAWAALSNAGYEENSKGKWIKKGAQVDLFELGEVTKAEYQGREVDLDKPFRLPSGSSKKFGVYVKDGDKVKRVTFGDPDMEIRRDDPEARANFRARHNCDAKKDKTTAGYWSCAMWSEAGVGDILSKEADVLAKRQINDDVFTLEREAMARSMEMGLGGATHVHQTADGQAVYMPGDTHEQYLEHYGTQEEQQRNEEEIEEEHEENGGGLLATAIRAIIGAILGQEEKKPMDYMQGRIMKADEEQRMVWGWASVVTEKGEPVVDRQGDIISPDEMVKAANEFMLDVRTAKAMHDGDKIGEVVHSMPLTNELAKSLGLETDREGWAIAMKIHDDGVWERVKSGELKAFSIGGHSEDRSAIDG